MKSKLVSLNYGIRDSWNYEGIESDMAVLQLFVCTAMGTLEERVQQIFNEKYNT